MPLVSFGEDFCLLNDHITGYEVYDIEKGYEVRIFLIGCLRYDSLRIYGFSTKEEAHRYMSRKINH